MAAVFGAVAFALGAALSFIPGLHDRAGVLVLGGIIAAIGAITLVAGLSDVPGGQSDALIPEWDDWEREGKRSTSRLGLSLLGGFVAAGLVLLSNWALLALGVPSS
jgi:hypothetical protein